MNENSVIPHKVEAIRAYRKIRCLDTATSNFFSWKYATYSRVGLGKALEKAQMEGSNSGLAGLLLVVIEPQVVCAIAAEIVRLSVQVQVPHIFVLL